MTQTLWRSTAVLLLLLACTYSAGAHARHGRWSGSVGFYYNDPWFWGPDPFWYPYRPYVYSPPPVIIEQREPPVYIQRPAAPQPQAPATVWYYCTNPAGYYPYVQNCTQPWVTVDPSTVAPAPAQ